MTALRWLAIAFTVCLMGCGKPHQVLLPPLEQGSIGMYAKVFTKTAPAEDLTQEDGTGIVVTRLIPGGPAEKAGVKPGDILLEIDGQKVNRASPAMQAIQNLAPGTQTVLKMKRGKQDQLFTIDVVPFLREPVEYRKPQEAPDNRPEPNLIKPVQGPVAPVPGGP